MSTVAAMPANPTPADANMDNEIAAAVLEEAGTDLGGTPSEGSLSKRARVVQANLKTMTNQVPPFPVASNPLLMLGAAKSVIYSGKGRGRTMKTRKG